MRYQAALRPDRPDWAGEAPSAPWGGMQGSPEQSRRTAMAAFRLDRCRRLDLAATDPISGALATGRGAHDRLRARPLHDRRRAIFARSLRRGSGAACNESSSSMRSEEHTSELQSLMRISYAVFSLKKKNTN